MASIQRFLYWRTLFWTVVWLSGAGSLPSGALHAQAAEAPGSLDVRTSLKIPSQHPYLLLTGTELEQAKKRAAQQPSGQQALDTLVRKARELAAKPLGTLPDKGDEAHWRVAERLLQVGLGYAFSGDRRLAEWVRDGLVRYADLYPTLPLTNLRCRVFRQSSLYEAMWAENIVQAYDLVADSGAFTPAQRQHVENDLLRKSVECFLVRDFDRDPRIRDLHYRCYNFQAWHIGAIGLAGLALRDAELVDYAVNSRYGFRHLVAHDIRDDGLFWERSVGYHHFVISALLPFTEAMYRCGVDLYALQVPSDRSSNEGCHYVTDTSDASKSLRMMFQTPIYMAFPNLTYPALGDSSRGPLRPDWHVLVAWNRYRDPWLAWMLRQQMGNAARAGFLHYYRYQYRYDDVRLNGQAVTWGRQDRTYQVDGKSIIASDGGERQTDRYLLNSEDLGDFVLEWSMTRLKDSGGEDRAWVVFQTNPRNPDERRCFGLGGHLPEIGRSYRFRLEVRGSQARLERDGATLSDRPQTYHATGDWRQLIYETPTLAAESVASDQQAMWKEQAVGNTGTFRNGCTLLPSSGLAVLREKPGDFTADLRATAVALSYGPYGGGHGHPDKLGIVVYAQGRQWVPHYGSMPYESNWKREWTSHTVSHNTLVIDGVSQRPAGDKDSMWPSDSGDQRVQGTLDQFDPEARMVTARCESAYAGFVLRRQVRLWRHCVVDRFEAVPDPAAAGQTAAPHQFDYVLHIDGTFAESAVSFAPLPGPLDKRCGYQFIEQLRSAVIEKPACVTFAADRDRLRIWMLPQNSSLQILVGQAPTNSPDERQPLLMLRQKGTSARFLTVLEPLGPQRLDAQGVLELVR